MSAQRPQWAMLLVLVWLRLPMSLRATEIATGVAPQSVPEHSALSDVIDRLISVRWQQAEVIPAERATDAEFLRRIYLDLAGRIPSVGEAREFLDSPQADRRPRLVERLLASPEFARWYSLRWSKLLLPMDNQFNNLSQSLLADWWYSRMLVDRRIDEITHELLTVSRVTGPTDRRGGDLQVQQAANGYRTVPALFYSAKANKPTDIAAALARNFLGLRLECAQCHDHPFAEWKQRDFWQLAAFFVAKSERSAADEIEIAAAFEIEIEGTSEKVTPAVPGGIAVVIDAGETDARRALANWLVSSDNPYFAKAVANRLCWMCFGRGLVDPVDDFDPANPASHPELLDKLAQALVQSNYDVRLVLGAITRSKVYQLTSTRSDSTQAHDDLFAVMPVRRMEVEQFGASVLRAIGETGPVSMYVLDGEGYRTTRLTALIPLFADSSQTPSAAPTSVAQALFMMNGPLTTQATTPSQGRLLGSVLEYPGWNLDQRLEALYLAVLARRPTPEEAVSVKELMDQKSADSNEEIILSNVYWSLLNSSEFLFNH